MQWRRIHWIVGRYLYVSDIFGYEVLTSTSSCSSWSKAWEHSTLNVGARQRTSHNRFWHVKSGKRKVKNEQNIRYSFLHASWGHSGRLWLKMRCLVSWSHTLYPAMWFCTIWRRHWCWNFWQYKKLGIRVFFAWVGCNFRWC